MRMLARLPAPLALLASLALAAACDGANDPAAEGDRDRGPVEARFEDYGVVIDNFTDAPVYFHIYRTGALALFADCLDPVRCTGVPARSSRAIPFAEITAWDAEADSVDIDFWHLVPDGRGGYRPADRGKVVATR